MNTIGPGDRRASARDRSAASRTLAALAGHITAVIGEWEDPAIERAIFGTADPERVARKVHDFCTAHLGAAIAAPLFFASGQGAVFGLRLTDRRRVVLKAHPPEQPLAFLRAVHQIRTHLASSGYPCPPALLGPAPIGSGHATVEACIDEGDYANPHEPAIRRAIAEQLASLVELTRQWVGMVPLTEPRNIPLPPDVLWPTPHCVIFDFRATADGAEWIDDLAWRAKRELVHAVGRDVIGHNDWSVKHFRFVGSTVRVIYDWDSLTAELEPVLVGRAARGFTMTYDTPWQGNVPMAPSLDELRAFIREYEAARGALFTAQEWRTAGAAAAYSMAYTSRCGHALDPRDGTGADFPPGSFRDALSRYGEALLGGLI